LQIKDLHLEINSIGCPECRAKYNEAIREYFGKRVEELCGNCKSRLEKNPMRLIDCKVPSCAEIAKDAPSILDYLCEECESHFEQVKKYLEIAGIEYQVNPTIVRGLDYYTKTVFEFVSDAIGSQGTVGGGGRYDGLIEQLGGQHLPSLGYAMGIERLLMVMENQGIEIPEPEPCALYIAGLGDKAQVKAFELVNSLRRTGLAAETDVVGRGLRAQMKYADKIGARFSMVIGDNELEQNSAEVKNMTTGEKTPLPLDDSFADKFAAVQLAEKFGKTE
jgi:histidyl-tRNA synthetase